MSDLNHKDLLRKALERKLALAMEEELRAWHHWQDAVEKKLDIHNEIDKLKEN